MNRNVGTVDNAIRLIIALLLFSLNFILEGNLRFLALIGFVPLITASISWCPLYRIFGIRTCKIAQ